MSKVFTISEGLENMGAIKSGGQGSVYKGRRVGEIITAIKLLPTPIFSQSDEDKHYRDFSNEVKKLQRVNETPNPNIVKILSFGVTETGCFPFIEMEFIDGPDLGELLKPPHAPVYTVSEVIKVAEQLCNALAHCHKMDIKHGDVKSNNVKYNRYTGNYVLLDFGLATMRDEERRTSLRHAGAIEFMAPEQNEGELLFQSDVYSFGIVLFELLAGKVPFPLNGNSETARNKVMLAHMEAPLPDLLSHRSSMLPANWPDEKKALEMKVPEWLVTLVYKCLEKAPQDRFDNALALQKYIAHHRVYTAEVAGLVQHEDARWKAVLAEKDNEVQELKTTVARQDKELQLLRQQKAGNNTTNGQRSTISKAAFNALLLALFVVSALAVYGLFFRHNRLVVANTGTERLIANDSMAAKRTNQKPVFLEKKKPAAKQEAKTPQVIAATTEKDKRGQVPAKEKKVLPQKVDTTVVDKAPAQPTEKADESSENTTAKETVVPARYHVRNRAYFFTEPDPGTKRSAFITHWDKPVKALDEKNGFIYIVFTNEEGQTTKGWISKDDLVQLK